MVVNHRKMLGMYLVLGEVVGIAVILSFLRLDIVAIPDLGEPKKKGKTPILNIGRISGIRSIKS